MPEFTVHIDTYEGMSTSEDVLGRVMELLNEDENALGAVASLEVHTGVIGSTFQVEAETFDEAARIAVLTFAEAITQATYDVAGELPEEASGVVEVHEDAASEPLAPIDRIAIERVGDREPVPA